MPPHESRQPFDLKSLNQEQPSSLLMIPDFFIPAVFVGADPGPYSIEGMESVWSLPPQQLVMNLKKEREDSRGLWMQ